VTSTVSSSLLPFDQEINRNRRRIIFFITRALPARRRISNLDEEPREIHQVSPGLIRRTSAFPRPLTRAPSGSKPS
jgi:hypothetical protein